MSSFQPPSPRRYPFFAVVAILFGLMLAEVTASGLFFMERVWRDGRVSTPVKSVVNTQWEVTDQARMMFVPNQKAAFLHGAPFRVNANGFRGAELKRRPVQVFCVGNSVTFGWSVSGDTGTYPYLLEQAIADSRVEVVNAGIPGAHVLDVLDLYAVRVAALQPDVVVILIGWNDIVSSMVAKPGTLDSNAPAPRSKPAWSTRLVESFQSLKLLHRVLVMINRPRPAEKISATDTAREVDAILTEFRGKNGQVLPRGLVAYERTLSALVALVRAQGATPVLVTLPHFHRGTLSRTDQIRLLVYLSRWSNIGTAQWRVLFNAVNQRIRDVAHKMGVLLIDAEAAVSPELFEDHCHPYDAGNLQLAEFMAPRLRELLSKKFLGRYENRG